MGSRAGNSMGGALRKGADSGRGAFKAGSQFYAVPERCLLRGIALRDIDCPDGKGTYQRGQFCSGASVARKKENGESGGKAKSRGESKGDSCRAV